MKNPLDLSKQGEYSLTVRRRKERLPATLASWPFDIFDESENLPLITIGTIQKNIRQMEFIIGSDLPLKIIPENMSNNQRLEFLLSTRLIQPMMLDPSRILLVKNPLVEAKLHYYNDRSKYEITFPGRSYRII